MLKRTHILSFLRNFNSLLSIGLFLLGACHSPLPPEVEATFDTLPKTIDFNFHIRPILADRCFSCHGPDENAREADLRLDLEKYAFAPSKNAHKSPFHKGSLDKSEAWNRMISEDPDNMMPPPESHLVLSDREKALIAKWIKQGADWKDHWAFIPPQKPEIPLLPENWKEDQRIQPRNEIDYFIFAKQRENGLNPSPEADKRRLIRRLSFDLRGLPPSPEEVQAFLADSSETAYKYLVEKFLNTEAYAERMAMDWMDIARFADSHGLHADGLREMWPWRDWVIEAFGKNIPYDDFVTWQLSGDLLPNPSREQKLATAFQRNQPLNSESGIVSEEFRLQYTADRTNTTATAFLGITMECATCHDHKFDPISQQAYYEMSAFFNNLNELGLIGTDKNFGPLLLLPKEEQEKELLRISHKIEESIKRRESYAENLGNSKKRELIKKYIESLDPQTIELPSPSGLYPLDQLNKSLKQKNKKLLDGNPLASVGGNPERVKGKLGNGLRIDNDYEQIQIKEWGYFDLYEDFSASLWIRPEKRGSFQTLIGNIGGKNTGWRGWVLYLDSLSRPSFQMVHSLSHNLFHVEGIDSLPINQWSRVSFTYDGSTQAEGLHIYINGQLCKTRIVRDNLYKGIKPLKTRSYIPNPEKGVILGIGPQYLYSDTDVGVYEGSYDQIRLFNHGLSPLEVAASFLQDEPTFIPPTFSEKEKLQFFLLREDEKYKQLERQLKELRKEKYALLDSIREIMVQEEMPQPRNTFILERGDYRNPGMQVFPSTPSAILPFTPDFPRNRLGLSKWIFSEKNPLTPRVVVNRYWQMIFGEGLVDTPHDFGTQGSLPSHPLLLDWLATRFRESGWDIKELLTIMLCSSTYRQQSEATPEKLAKDPKNRLYSHGASFQLPAEMIRDNALAVSQLLNKKVGGPSVKPYQPEGLWKEKNEFSGFLNTYTPDSGSNLYRRSLYTFIRRTSPPPAMAAFNLPQRDVCTMKRERTNTPLQALVLMNDPQIMESCRVFAEILQKEGGESPTSQIQYGFLTLFGREIPQRELELLLIHYQKALESFENNPEKAQALLKVGAHPSHTQFDSIKTAALTLVSNTMLNFDEAYMKR